MKLVFNTNPTDITAISSTAVQLWNRVRGKRLLLNTAPTQPLINDTDLGFFTVGTQSLTIYQMDRP